MRRHLLAFALLFVGCLPERPSPQSEPPPTVTLYGMKLQSFRGENVVAAGRAAKLTYVRNTADFVASEVLIRFPSSSGIGVGHGFVTGGMEVRAPTLTGNQNARQAEGQGGVVLRSGDGVVARTEKVNFDGVTRVASGETRVDAVGPKYALSADRFRLHFATEVFEFDGNVETRLGADGGTP